MRAVRPAPVLLLALAGALVGCVAHTQLVPAPGVPSAGRLTATAEGEGVRLVADTDAWRGNPPDLERVLVPVRVQVENHSGRPLRLGHGAFELAGDSGFRFAALSPFAAGSGAWAAQEQTDAVLDRRPAVSLRGGFAFGYGWGPPGSWGPWGPWGYGPWGPGPWWDPFWGPWGGWGYAGPPVVVEPLPTRDMVRKALPEGALEDGGTVSGFLYFPDVGTREQRVVLTATLTDAQSGETFGTLRIPFQVQR